MTPNSKRCPNAFTRVARRVCPRKGTAAGWIFPSVTMGGQVLVLFWGVLATALWSGVLTRILLKPTGAPVGMRADPEEHNEGLDAALHNEMGYDL